MAFSFCTFAQIWIEAAAARPVTNLRNRKILPHEEFFIIICEVPYIFAQNLISVWFGL
jgi:hypothetical protein